jgi:excisionase family DNA binding protein
MRLLTIQETADFLRVTESRAYHLVRSGMIPQVRIGRQIRIDENALHQWVARGGHPLPHRTVSSEGNRRAAESSDPREAAIR